MRVRRVRFVARRGSDGRADGIATARLKGFAAVTRCSFKTVCRRCKRYPTVRAFEVEKPREKRGRESERDSERARARERSAPGRAGIRIIAYGGIEYSLAGCVAHVLRSTVTNSLVHSLTPVRLFRCDVCSFPVAAARMYKRYDIH